MRNLKIQFGCGKRKNKDYCNVDICPDYDPEILWDLNTFPYPFSDNSAKEIICEMTLEHIIHPSKAIDEFHRIIQPNGKIFLRVPHFSHSNSFVADWHICVFNTEYFWARKQGNDSRDVLNWNPVKNQFKQVKVEILFPKGKLTILSLPFQLLFGKSRLMHSIYEQTFLKSLYPASEIIIELCEKISSKY